MTALGEPGRAARVTGWRRFFAREGELRIPPRRLATALLLIVIGLYGLLAVLGVLFAIGRLDAALLSVSLVVALVLLQGGYLSRPDHPPRPPLSYLALALQAVLVLLPLFAFGPIWYGFPGLLAGSALLLLPPVAGVAVAVVTVLVITAIGVQASPLTELHGTAVAIVSITASTVTSAIAVYGLSRLARLVIEAHEARDELRRAAVARERVRFVRDLNDVLGQSVSAITLRCELVARLLRQQPARAHQELSHIRESGRSASVVARSVLAQGRDDEEDGEAPLAPGPAPSRGAVRLSRVLLTIVMVGFAAVAVTGVAVERGPGAAVVAALLGLAAVGLVVGYVARRPTGRGRLAALAVLAVLAFAPMPLFGPAWHGIPGILGGAALLLLPPTAALAALTLTVAGVLLAEYLDPAPTDAILHSLLYAGVGLLLISLIVYGVAAVARLVVEINGARRALATLAVAQERVRIGRDVHDLLGISLSTIMLKCELADRVLDVDPDRAALEVGEVLVAARRALADIRTLVGGTLRLSLDDECRLAETTLASADVRVRLERAGGSPAEPAGTLLATVLREGVTNVLRHSSARWCDITLTRAGRLAVLDIVNDGAHPDGAHPGCADPDGARAGSRADGSAAAGDGAAGDGEVGDGAAGEVGGNGLVNMSERLGEVGGRLVVSSADGVYSLRAQVPARR